MSLNENESASVANLLNKLGYFQKKNRIKHGYYEAKNDLKEITKITQVNFDDAVNSSVGLAGTVVDTINSRIKLKSISIPEEGEAIKKVLKENEILEHSSLIHVDALIFGVNFLLVGKGNPELGEPSTLVTIESPNTLTVNVNPRTRKITEALQIVYSEQGMPLYSTYISPNLNIGLRAVNEGTDKKPIWGWVEESRDEHNLGFVPVIPFAYKKRTRDVGGRSLISPVVMGCVDSIQRTNFMLEITRDFYGMPQKIFIGGDKNAFKGNRVWKAYADVMLSVGWQQKQAEDGSVEWIKPEIQQFAGQSPTPLIELNRETTRQLSVESTIPQTHFGLQYANPSSEGATRIGESSMLATCEAISTSFEAPYKTLIKYIAAFEYETTPDWVYDVSIEWADPAILTKEGERDFILDLADRGIIQKDSDFLFETLGIGEAVRQKIREENAAAEANSLLNTLSRLEATPEAQALAAQNTEETLVDVDTEAQMKELKLRFDALGVAVRAGVNAEAAAERVGLGGIEMSGLQPTTLKAPGSE